MDLHPHWDATGDDDAPLSAVVTPSHSSHMSIPIATGHMSRRPAAAIGIVIAVVLGITYSNGWDDIYQQINGMRAQINVTTPPATTAPQDLTIALTKTGVDPASITAQPGQIITFRNDTDIPQLLESQTLFVADGTPMSTPAIFPGATQSVTLSAAQIPGTYTYASTTNSGLAGTINIQGNGQPVSQPTSDTQPAETVHPVSFATDITDSINDSVSSDPSLFDQTPPSDTASGLLPSAPEQPVNAVPAASAEENNVGTALPQNPYVVGSNYTHPFDANGQPIPDAFNPDGSLKRDALHAGASQIQHTPSTANSGPGLWVVIILSTAVLWIVVRKQMHPLAGE